MQGDLWSTPSPVRRSSHALRPYQVQALDGIRAAFEQHQAALLILPTGCGKTTVFAKAIEERVRQYGERALVLAHREELIRQGAHRLVADTTFAPSQVGVEMADERCRSSHQVVVASVQSLHARRLSRFDPGEVQFIVVDEAHHATASSYLAILNHFSGAKVLGVTATPDRADGSRLGKVFQVVAYAYEIRDAISDGYLVPLRCLMVEVERMDLSKVRTTAGDLNEGDLGKVMELEANLHGVAKPTLEQAGERPTIVFATRVSHALALAEVFNRYKPGCAAAIHADSNDRHQVLDAYRSGRLQYVVNVGILTEGFDAPLTACIAMARPTKSRALYAQCVGRGTRLLGATWPESQANGKEDCLILDFVGNSGRHRLVCALDILDSAVDEEVSAVAKRKVKERGLLVTEALAEAEAEVAKARRLKLALEVRYRTIEITDQFTLLGIAPRAGRWGGATITAPQFAALTKAGVVRPERLDRGQASEMMDAILERRRKGLCTLRQAKILMRAGLNPDLSFDRAHEVIDILANNGWRPTSALLEAYPVTANENR